MRWRPALMVASVTVLGWLLVLGKLRAIVGNPDVYTTSEVVGPIVAGLALIVIDTWAVWYGLKDFTDRDRD
jgi:hypothetical protein